MSKMLPTLRVALARGEEIRKLKQIEQQLNHTLNNSRDISVAMGILMERRQLANRRKSSACRHN